MYVNWSAYLLFMLHTHNHCEQAVHVVTKRTIYTYWQKL